MIITSGLISPYCVFKVPNLNQTQREFLVEQFEVEKLKQN